MTERQMRLGAFMRPLGIHTAWWRYPGAYPDVPGGLDNFVEQVVPELQRRGLFRREYEGKTLRENLGLPRPKNKFFG